MENCKLTLDGPGLSFTREISQSLAMQVMAVVVGVDGVSPKVERMSPEAEKVSLREFLNETKGTNNVDKILLFTFHLITYEGQEIASRNEIKSSFKKAHEPLPANFSRDLLNTLKKGWLVEDKDNEGSFYVTRKGRDAVERLRS